MKYLIIVLLFLTSLISTAFCLSSPNEELPSLAGTNLLLLSSSICTDTDSDGFYAEDDCKTLVDCNDNDPAIYPMADEVCNGLDDDCDGEVDEGCNIGLPCEGIGECGAGLIELIGENEICSTEPGGSGDQSTPEVCNGLDDDCDGEVDEGCNIGLPCEGIGECGAGLIELVGENEICSTEPGGSGDQSTPEVCNGLDDDCDGEVDEGCNLVINEIDYDQYEVDNLEFIEIYNPTPTAIDLTGVGIHLVNGYDGSIYSTIDFSTLGPLASDGYLLVKSPLLGVDPHPNLISIDFPIYENNIQNGPDGVQLVILLGGPGEHVIDSIAYEGEVANCTEGNPVPSPADSGDGSLGRFPNGTDSNDNSLDFIYDYESPGEPNL
jgi:Putative metal-binding motif